MDGTWTPFTPIPSAAAFDLRRADAGPLFMLVHSGRGADGLGHLHITRGAAADGLGALWDEVDAAYRLSQGYFFLLRRRELHAGGAVQTSAAPSIAASAWLDRCPYYFGYTEPNLDRGAFLALPLEEDAPRLRLDRKGAIASWPRAAAAQAAAAAAPEPCLVAEVLHGFFWHIHM